MDKIVALYYDYESVTGFENMFVGVAKYHPGWTADDYIERWNRQEGVNKANNINILDIKDLNYENLP